MPLTRQGPFDFLLYDQVSPQSKSKPAAVSNNKYALRKGFCFLFPVISVVKIVEREEYAACQHFLLFEQSFENPFFFFLILFPKATLQTATFNVQEESGLVSFFSESSGKHRGDAYQHFLLFRQSFKNPFSFRTMFPQAFFSRLPWDYLVLV